MYTLKKKNIKHVQPLSKQANTLECPPGGAGGVEGPLRYLHGWRGTEGCSSDGTRLPFLRISEREGSRAVLF